MTVRAKSQARTPARTPRPEGWDYMTDGGRITRSSAPRPEPFTWGKVLKVHVVGDDYAIAKYTPYQARYEDFDPSPSFHLFVRGAADGLRSWDTNHSYRSLDAALIAAIAWRSEERRHGRGAAANSQAARYVSRLLELER